MKLALKTVFAAGLMVGVVSLGATAAAALPLLDGKVATQIDASKTTVDKVYYRCYRCYRRRVYGYRYYRPYYGYGYYHPYYYRPHIGIGIGGVGIGLY